MLFRSHLGAIPRKPDDPNDPLSIMWWDPTGDDFESFGGSLVDGLGQLSGSKVLSLRKMLSSMEGRIEDHKRAGKGGWVPSRSQAQGRCGRIVLRYVYMATYST